MTGLMSLFDLTGRTALVTGAGQGLGKGMALALAEAGADVVIADVRTDTAKQTADEIERLGRKAMTIQASVARPEEVQAMAWEALDRFGAVDILVNNAGISRHTPSASMPLDEWNVVMEVNVTGVFLCCQAFAPTMIARRWGRIVNIASMSGYIVNRNIPQAPYYASKAGVIMLTKALAAEWGPHNVTVNAIAPGYMRTPLNDEFLADPGRAREWANGVPLGRVGEPRDLAGAVVYLASEASSYVTGHTLVVDGGFTVW